MCSRSSGVVEEECLTDERVRVCVSYDSSFKPFLFKKKSLTQSAYVGKLLLHYQQCEGIFNKCLHGRELLFLHLFADGPKICRHIITHLIKKSTHIIINPVLNRNAIKKTHLKNKIH